MGQEGRKEGQQRRRWEKEEVEYSGNWQKAGSGKHLGWLDPDDLSGDEG